MPKIKNERTADCMATFAPFLLLVGQDLPVGRHGD